MKHNNTNYDYGIPIELLRFLGACIYGDAVAFYNELNENERSKLESQGKKNGMTVWFYRYLYSVLPEEKRTAYQKIYQARQVKALIGARELKRLFGVLASHGLRFVPIKGSDLAYRLYPDAALRVFVDWDIWFHLDDCERALAVLAEDGWKMSGESLINLDIAQASGAHHFPAHVRGQYTIETHFKPANFDGIDLYEMWNHTLEYPNGDGQRVLSPIMNLLMLTRHAASKLYYHAQLPKLLIDAAMVMQNEQVNYVELRKLANSWNLPYPCDLLAAFPEFFPSNVIEAFQADMKKAEDFRKIFEARGKLGEQDITTLLLSRYEIRGQIANGILKHIKAHSPSIMRLVYHLPEHGAWGQVLWAYICWFWTRTWRSRVWIRRNPILREYAHIVETAESTKKEKEQHSRICILKCCSGSHH